MKHFMIQRRVFTKFASRLVAIALFVTFLSLTPFDKAIAQTQPDLGSADGFAVLGGTAVSLTGSTIIGDVGSPTAVTLVGGSVVGTVYPVGDSIVLDAYDDFLLAYDTLALEQCDQFLTGDMAGLTLSPGVYCVEAASTTTNGTLTLNGPADGIWIFLIGTGGTGALTGTNFTVTMDGGALPCNVYWWVKEATTMTTSNFKGSLLAGTASTFTGGSFMGSVMTHAGLTMTGSDAIGCNNIVPPVPPTDDDDDDSCWHHDKDKDKHHDKDKDKHHDKDKDKKHHKKYDKDKDKKHDKDKDKYGDSDHKSYRK
jgi:hypothetical protein